MLVLAGIGALLYFRLGGSPEVKRDRALKRASEYMQQSKVNEAVIEFKNALQFDPNNAAAHMSSGWHCSEEVSTRPLRRDQEKTWFLGG